MSSFTLTRCNILNNQASQKTKKPKKYAVRSLLYILPHMPRRCVGYREVDHRLEPRRGRDDEGYHVRYPKSDIIYS